MRVQFRAFTLNYALSPSFCVQLKLKSSRFKSFLLLNTPTHILYLLIYKIELN